MRNALQDPIPELAIAADLLSQAVDAVLDNNAPLASSLIRQSDLPEIMEYAVRAVGKMTLEVHRSTTRPKVLPKAERHPIRMPPQSYQTSIFERDGWHCRFCGSPVICKTARARLVKLFPTETHWNGKEFQRHSALYAMASSLDHVVPHGRGGVNEESNFVTACYCCQFGRGEWMLEEVEVSDPRQRPPITTSWDGLTHLNRHK